MAPQQDNAWFYDRNRPSVIAQNTVIGPDSATLPTVYSSVRCVLPSEHGPARLTYFEELEEIRVCEHKFPDIMLFVIRK